MSLRRIMCSMAQNGMHACVHVVEEPTSKYPPCCCALQVAEHSKARISLYKDRQDFSAIVSQGAHIITYPPFWYQSPSWTCPHCALRGWVLPARRTIQTCWGLRFSSGQRLVTWGLGVALCLHTSRLKQASKTQPTVCNCVYWVPCER